MKSEKGQNEFSTVRSQLNQQTTQIKQLENELRLTKTQLENCDNEMIELQRENQELKSQASFNKARFLANKIQPIGELRQSESSYDRLENL